MLQANQVLEKAREVMRIETEGLNAVTEQLGDDFVRLTEACIQVLNNGGKIVVAGVGKSGHIGRKISASLASTGSPSIFMHPVEAMHGDLGMLQENDLLLALSYSGETAELNSILLPAKRLGVLVTCFTGVADSTLAKMSEIAVVASIPREACPFNLAPTTTSTAHLALGDALAMTLLQLRHFTKEDYGMRHPSGAIGRAVSMHVKDLIRPAERTAVVEPSTPVKDVLLKMTKARTGSAAILGADNKIMGIFTDGDFRRCVSDDLSVLSKPIADVMTKNPVSIQADSLAVEILKLVEKKPVDDIVVLNADGTFAGMVDIQDLPRFKVM